MKIAHHEELKEWQEKHGVTLQLGLMVRLTDEGNLRDFPPEGEEFMITGLNFSNGCVRICMNTHGEEGDLVPCYSRIYPEDIEPSPGDL